MTAEALEEEDGRLSMTASVQPLPSFMGAGGGSLFDEIIQSDIILHVLTRITRP